MAKSNGELWGMRGSDGGTNWDSGSSDGDADAVFESSCDLWSIPEDVKGGCSVGVLEALSFCEVLLVGFRALMVAKALSAFVAAVKGTYRTELLEDPSLPSEVAAGGVEV